MNNQDLINKIKQLEGLTDAERAVLVNSLNTDRKYGLIWEDKPEDAEELLRTHLPVLKEVEERRIIASPSPSEGGEKHHLAQTRQAELFDTEEDTTNIDTASSSSPSGRSGGAPNHILIEGDNLHALTALTFTHENKIDVIYIDPPYNTGNKDFKYNDAFVDKEDSYRHSKWLSFMHKRLEIAKRLLSDKGVIFISIDDNEIAQLKILCNEIFQEENMLAVMIWQQGKKSSGNLIGVNHEYMLVYAKNRSLIDNPNLSWKQKKDGLEKIYKKFENLKKEFKTDYNKIEQEIKTWFNSLAENDPAYSSKHYSLVDEKGLFFADNSCAPDRPETRCHKPLIHPITKKETAVPTLGWRWKEDTLDKMVLDGKIYFGKEESTVPKVKKYLKDMETELPSSIFYRDGRGASAELEMILGEKMFNNPKDRNEIARVLNFRYNGLILDFFAGSGTTLHATMQLNAEDGGSRQCILVTNNENNICEEVTYERNKRVIQGYTNAKGVQVEGLTNNNLRYYQSDYISRDRTHKNKRELVYAATEMLCIKEDIYTELDEIGGEKLIEKDLRCFSDKGQYMLVVYNEEIIDWLAPVIAKIDTQKKIKIYIFAPGQYPFTEEFEDVLDKVELCALPDAIYKAYANVLPKKQAKTIITEIEEEENDKRETSENSESELISE